MQPFVSRPALVRASAMISRLLINAGNRIIISQGISIQFKFWAHCYFSEPLVDQSSLDGGIGDIKKANADEFIHIFVNQSDKLTEFLEHMIKVIVVTYVLPQILLQCS